MPFPDHVSTQVTINSGFVTNSSSVVFHAPTEVLEDERVQEFLARYEVDGNGRIDSGGSMFDRQSTAISLGREGRRALQKEFDRSAAQYDFDVSVPQIPDEEGISVRYGDEYNTLASALCTLLRRVASDLGVATSRDDVH